MPGTKHFLGINSLKLCKLHFTGKEMEAELLRDFGLVTELQDGGGCI